MSSLTVFFKVFLSTSAIMSFFLKIVAQSMNVKIKYHIFFSVLSKQQIKINKLLKLNISRVNPFHRLLAVLQMFVFLHVLFEYVL